MGYQAGEWTQFVEPEHRGIFSVVRSFLYYSLYMNPRIFFNVEAFSSVDNKPYTDASAAQQDIPKRATTN